MIDVSIIMPVYQVASYIGDCLMSVMRQTYTGSMECLIVDDGSTDDSISIAERMIDAYDGSVRFQILRHEKNLGLSAARNTGTLQATGEFLYFIDSDDEMTEDCIEKLMAIAREKLDVEMVQGNALIYPIQKKAYLFVGQIIIQTAVNNDEVRKCYYQYNQITCTLWNKLLRRDFIINNNLLCREGIIYEDVLWGFYLVKHLTKACFVSDVTYYGKKRPGSITTDTDRSTRMANYAIAYQDVLTHLTPGHEQEEFYDYSNKIIGSYCKFVYKVPTCEEVLQLCREKSELYGSRYLRFKLTVISYLFKFRYGWVVMAFLKRMKHPDLLRRDMHRLRW